MKQNALRPILTLALAFTAAACTGADEDDPIYDETNIDPSVADTLADPPADPPDTIDEALVNGTQSPNAAAIGINKEAEIWYAVQVEAENMYQISGVTGVHPSGYALAGNGWVRIQFANGDMGQWFWAPYAGWHNLSLAMQGSWCTRGYPTATAYFYDQSRGYHTALGGGQIGSGLTCDPNCRYFPYWYGGVYLNAGWNWVLVRMGNDSYVGGYCDANLVVDYANIWR